MRPIKEWMRILAAARRLSRRPGGALFTSSELATGAGVTVRFASAWLAKFYRWGYALRSGKAPAGGRWAYQWVLTRWGLRVEIDEVAVEPAVREGSRVGGARKVAANPKKGD